MQPPDAHVLARVAAALACLGCLALVVEPRLSPSPWIRRAFAVALTLASVATYYEFFSAPGQTFIHRWEMFHYVLGSKYAPELGYERLYVCVALAEVENGREAEVRAHAIRDLRNDELLDADVALTESRSCQRHFTPARWAAFRHDVDQFRRIVSEPKTWARMQTDHGYNPSPVWTMLGRPLASAAPIDSASLLRLAYIDPLLMAAGLGLFAWAFGARVAFVAAVFWSTQSPSSFTWTGGAFLRQDWLVLAIASLALARRGYFRASGACLAWSALLRIFPLLYFGGPLVLATASWLRHRVIPLGLRRFFSGAALSSVLLVGASAASGATLRSWSEFGAHAYMHSRSPIANHMSLRTLVSFDPRDRLAELQTGDESAWPEARRARYEARLPLMAAIAALCVFALVRCVKRLHTLWLAIPLSFLLVVTLTDPSSYYYSMVVLCAPLLLARRGVGVVLLGLAAASELLLLHFRAVDERYAALSALYFAFACVLVALFSRSFSARPRPTL